YCDYEGGSDTFWTPAQLDYAKSVALNQAYSQFIKPSIDNLFTSFKDLEKSSRNSFFQFKVNITGQEIRFPIKYYKEEELETNLICDSCALEFAIFGVFARCPDCSQLNAFLIFEKSIEAVERQLDIISKPE